MRLYCLSADLFQPNRCLFNVRSAFYRQVFLAAEYIAFYLLTSFYYIFYILKLFVNSLVVFLGPQCKLLGLPVIVTAIKVLLLLLLLLLLLVCNIVIISVHEVRMRHFTFIAWNARVKISVKSHLSVRLVSFNNPLGLLTYRTLVANI